MTEFDKFDAIVRRVFSVPHTEIVKREKEYKKQRKQAKKKRDIKLVREKEQR